MARDLAEVYARLDWCSRKIEALEQKANHFHSYAYQAIQRPLRTGHTALIVKNASAIPIEFCIEAGVICNELRASLDQLACCLAVRHNPNCSLDKISFPISKSASAFAGDGKRKIKKLSPADQAKIEALKPYHGGYDLLFALHRTDLTRKHIQLVGVAPNLGDVNIGSGAFTSGTSFRASGTIPEFGEITLAILGPGSSANIQVNVDICFNSPHEIAGRPIIHTLRDFAKATKDIIELFSER